MRRHKVAITTVALLLGLFALGSLATAGPDKDLLIESTTVAQTAVAVTVANPSNQSQTGVVIVAVRVDGQRTSQEREVQVAPHSSTSMLFDFVRDVESVLLVGIIDSQDPIE